MLTTSDFLSYAGDRFKLKVVAGEGALSKPALWLYMAEDSSSFGFIRGGELAVTTGMSIRNSRELYMFISDLIDKDASGLIINLGRYLKEEDITRDIKKMCSITDFALLTMPWEMHLSDLMQAFADLHFKSKTKDDSLNAALTDLCHGVNIENHRELMESLKLSDEDFYAVGTIDAKKPVLETFKDVFITSEGIVLFHNPVKEKMVHICDRIGSTYGKIGVGQVYKGYGSMAKSYDQAKKALKIAKYKDMPAFNCELGGIYKLFLTDEVKELKSYCEGILSPLIAYDKEHNSELISTLSAYIKYRGSLKAVADNTACHRNTVAYRMEKIRQLLNNDMEDGDYFSELNTAIAALEYVEAMEA